MLMNSYRDADPGDIVTAEDPGGALAAKVGGVSVKNAIIYGSVFWFVTRVLDGAWDVFKARIRRRR